MFVTLDKAMDMARQYGVRIILMVINNVASLLMAREENGVRLHRG